MKTCTGCGETKPLDQFYKERRGKYGVRSRCIACFSREDLEWRLANPEAFLERHRRANAKRRKAHYEYSKQYRAENRDKFREYYRRQYALRRGVSSEDREYVDVLRGDPCSYCGAPAVGADHVDPLSQGGDGGWGNLTATCGSCNSQKHTIPLLKFLLKAA